MSSSFMKRIVAAVVVVVCIGRIAQAQVGAPQNVPAPKMMTVTKSQHVRLPLPFDLLRFAVGDPEVLSAEPIGTRELLLLGKGSGRTTMIVWFRNGDVQEFVVTVQRDLSILQSALRRLYPTIEVEIAPDRDAIILSGTVPDLSYSLRAEALAQDYINAGPRVLIPAAAPVPGTPAAAPAAAQPGVQAPAQAPVPGQPPAVNVVVQGQIQPVALPTGTVINLIQLENLPPTPEEKIRQAIQGIGGVPQ
jgi:pilus assembly protein CpaC